MTAKAECLGFSEQGDIDHSVCESQAHAVAKNLSQKTSISHDALKTYEHDYDASTLPDCPNCTENCCSDPHVTTLSHSDISLLKQAGFAWAIATPRPNSDDVHPSLKQVDGRCAFLTSNNRCSIYPIRPLVCRAFPLQVAEGGQLIRYASSCHSRGSACSPQTLQEMAAYAVESFTQKSKPKESMTASELSEAKRKKSFDEILSKKIES